MEVSKSFGMLQPGASNTKAVRAVFIIDPKGIIRAIIYYPLSLGATSTSCCGCCWPCRPPTHSPSPPRPTGARATT